ncbi:zinc ABC transporter substrate-binding protein [Acinetobacter sp. Marseille-Q1623]|uniref:zinc ABC transporter substrate-binding protein n=1 Tax=Acinetobacter sp. Marseille-Q1623 TaxID=2697501 RepID=UPI00157B08D4|nr:zinc ABC transporter substrate-binding protein [Acinetobacter sp. Marseille-Q1623]
MNKQELLNEIQKLEFPNTDFIIVGGGALVIRNLRETSDLDIVVTAELFEKLKNDNKWSYTIRPNGKPKLYKDFVEVYLDVNTDDFQRTTSQLFENADIFNQIQFINLQTLMQLKQSYRREKDLHDIELIQTYLATQKMK